MCQIFNFFGAAKGAAIEVQNLNPIFFAFENQVKNGQKMVFSPTFNEFFSKTDKF